MTEIQTRFNINGVRKRAIREDTMRMIETNITKERVNELPLAVFEGKIVLIDEIASAHHALEELNKAKLIGIDTETKPAYARGQNHKVALLQMAVDDCCYLFRLNKFTLPKEIADILSNSEVRKVGIALRDDFAGLNKQCYFKPENVVDLQQIVKNYGIFELGLQKMYALLFQKKISKNQRLTNWESPILTPQQQLYAATDAWAALRIYKELQNRRPLTKIELQALIDNLSAIQQNQSIKPQNNG